MRNYTLPIIIERDADGFCVSCPRLQGCYSQGDTYDEALSNIKDAIRLHLKTGKRTTTNSLNRNPSACPPLKSPSDAEAAASYRT